VAAPLQRPRPGRPGDLPRSGLPRRLSEHQRGRIIQLAGTEPPGRLQQGGEGLLAPEEPEAPAQWTLDALTEAAQAEGVRVGRSQVRRILLAEGARWRQPRSWAHSTDPEFVPKVVHGPGPPATDENGPVAWPTSSALGAGEPDQKYDVGASGTTNCLLRALAT
jgi:transposase